MSLIKFAVLFHTNFGEPGVRLEISLLMRIGQGRAQAQARDESKL